MLKKLILSTLLVSASSGLMAQTQVTIHANQGQQKIYKELYGQFAEHLGTCIYGGLWVGPNSRIPNTDGYRSDVFNALKELRVPVLRWRAVASPTNITGWTASDLAANAQRCKTTTGAAPSRTTLSVRMSS